MMTLRDEAKESVRLTGKDAAELLRRVATEIEWTLCEVVHVCRVCTA